jgi:cation diffusion facilitator family transporter
VSDCGCSSVSAATAAERRALRVALGLNASMFLIGTAAGLMARSSGLLADAIDMLADACAYSIALLAIGRSDKFKRRAAFASGVILGVLGLGIIGDAARRALTNSHPEGVTMLTVASLSLTVNLTVLRLLRSFRQGEVHLRATWLFTRADVIANLGVILAGALVLWTGSRFPDLILGAAIGVYVAKEALEILRIERASDSMQSTND